MSETLRSCKEGACLSVEARKNAARLPASLQDAEVELRDYRGAQR